MKYIDSAMRVGVSAMKKLMLLAILMVGYSAGAQTTYTIGTGTSTVNYFPLYSCYGYNYTQQIYLASDLSAAGASAGLITKIRFQVGSMTTTTNWDDSWVVYLGNTSQSSFASSTNWVPVTSMTQVYSGSVSPPSTSGAWMEITLDTPFMWNGSDNIVVGIDENEAGYNCTAYWRYTTNSANRAIGYYSDFTNPSPASPPTANVSSLYWTRVPNIQFDITSGACTNPVTGGSVTASVDSVCLGTSVALGLSGASTGLGMTYQWQDSVAGGSWANISGATSPSYSTTLTTPTYFRCELACSGGTPAYSDTAMVGIEPFYNCYCASAANYTYDTKIESFQMANVSTQSPSTSTCENYTDYTSNVINLLQGATHNLTITNGSCSGYHYTAYMKAWIDYNQNGQYETSEEVYAGGATSALYQTWTGGVTVPTTALTGTTGMRVILSESSYPTPCGTYYYGETEDYTVNIQTPPANDVGVAEIVTPVIPYCGGDSVVRVRLSNFGTDTLFSANINLSINGGTAVVTNWTGMIPPFTTDTAVIAAGTNPSGSFVQGDDIVVYGTLPNGVADSLPMNDTATLYGLNAGLSGVYTIPGSFATISGAVDTLNQFGTCDTVWFDIASGTYNEAVSILQFPRYTADAPVIFRSATGNMGDVVWETTTSPILIELVGADYIWFENMTLKDTTSAGQNVIFLSGGANYNKVEGCHVKGQNISTTSNLYAVIKDNNGVDEGNMFKDNIVEGGSYGIYAYGGGSTSLQDGLKIIGNEVKDFYYMGTYCYYNNDITYNGNKIHSNGTYVYKYGAYFYYAMGNIEMIGNHIYPDSPTNGFVYPLYMSQAVGSSPLNRDMIANNVIVGGWEGSTYTLYGARFYNASFKNFHHNTFINIDGSSSSYAFLASGNNVCEYANNIYAALPTDTSASYAYGAGYGAYHTGGAVLVSDNNDYYTGGNFPLYFNGGLDLATHQANNNLDLNSYDVDPNFIDTIQAILCNDILDNAGMAVGINEDIWGNVRNANTPDIGAVEFTGVGNFSLGPDTTICDAGTVLYIGGATSSLTWLDGNSNVIGTGSSLNVDGSTVMPVSVNFSNSCGSASDDVALDFVPNVSMDETMHLCAGESEVLMPDGSGSVNASYTWFPTNETTSQITIDGPGVYSVHKSEDGCESDATILVTQSQAVDLVDVEACQSSLPYSADATINAGDSYAWSDGGTSATNDLSTTGVYYVTATDTLGCASVDSMYFEAIDIPSAVIASDSHTSTLYFFNSMQSTGVGSNGTYAWDFGDGNTSSMANPSNNFPWSGSPVSYTVTLVITNACGTSEPVTMQVSVDPLGVNDVNGIANLSIFPNPTTGLITITGDFNGEASVEVLDVAGRVVYSANELTATDRMNLDLTGLATGAYQVKVSSGNAVSQAQVIIK